MKSGYRQVLTVIDIYISTPISQAAGLCGAFTELCEGEVCDSVSLPALECDKCVEKEEPTCDCCDDAARRRLLWTSNCPCCKTNGHAAWSAHHKTRPPLIFKVASSSSMLADDMSGSTAVDVAIKTDSSAAPQIMEDLSDPEKINAALEGIGLPAVQILQAPKLVAVGEQPPVNPKWPHHDAQLWKEVKLESFVYHSCVFCLCSVCVSLSAFVCI